jgi:nucleoside-diphosphate-sugar epimerase
MRTDFPAAAATDLAVVRALGDALDGTGKTLIGIGLKKTGDPRRDAAIDANPRSVVSQAISDYGDRGVRTILVAIPPVTHSSQDKHGFIPMLIDVARATGVSGYAGDGSNTWPAAHTLDVAVLYRLALKQAPAGAQLFAATEEGIPVREIAEVIGRHLGLPVESIPAERVPDHFRAFPFIALDFRMPSTETQQLLGWHPSHPGLIADLDEGHYFTAR